MLLSEVGYARPATLEQALGVLADYPGARALAGGQTLVNVMKARAAAPDVLVDLAGIPELKGIELGPDGTLELGAMVTYSELIASAEARARPILGEVCAQIADVQVRNRGTIGGNVCSSDPTNHLPPLFVALGADFTVVGPGGERTVPAQDFFLGVYMTAAGPGELLTKITVPPGRSDGFASVPIGVRRNLHRERGRLGQRRRPGRARLCRRDAGRGRARRPRTRRPSSGAVRDSGIDPPSDVHASSEYRRRLAEVVAARAVEQAGKAS